MKIRAMTSADCQEAAMVHQTAFIRQGHSLQWVQCNFSAYPRTFCFVAENQQNIQGFIFWTQRAGFRQQVVLELEQLAVHPSVQRQGIARRLIRESLPMVKDKLTERDAIIKHIVVSTRTDNFAQKLYRDELGAKPEHTIKDFYSFDEVCMIARHVENKF